MLSPSLQPSQVYKYAFKAFFLLSHICIACSPCFGYLSHDLHVGPYIMFIPVNDEYSSSRATKQNDSDIVNLYT